MSTNNSSVPAAARDDPGLFNVMAPQPTSPTLPKGELKDELRDLSIEEVEGPAELPQLRPPRPETPKRRADPAFPPFAQSQAPVPRPRARSPYSRNHLRSRSSSGSSTLSAPPMTRAHSLPTVINTAAQSPFSPFGRPSSPRSPARLRSPFRSSSEEIYPHAMSTMHASNGFASKDFASIAEDSELDLTPRARSTDRTSQGSPVLSLPHGNTFPRRRRPASPLHQVSSAFASVSLPSSTHSSPLLSASKFNEPFPTDINIHYPGSFASSSVPSTPTSMRSRSPSISSLETIPDAPDAEEAALESERIAKLKAAADAADAAARGEDSRDGSLGVPNGRFRGLGFGTRDKRKRWSVCGAERRGDLDLETIWED